MTTEPKKPEPKKLPTVNTTLNFDPKYLLGAGGPLAQVVKNYQVREPQIMLADSIRTAFREDKHLVSEAPTGIGKSYACLLAAFEKVIETGSPVVISTHTIALQEQLCNKDVPKLLDAFNLKLNVVLAKGRGNYVSIRRAKLAIAEKLQDHTKLASWLYKTKDGTKESLTEKIDHHTWYRARSDTDQCLGELCTTFNQCFYQKARRDLTEAHVIITNHNLVLLDLKIKSEGLKGVLPEYQHLIIDEAHEFEGVARQVLTFEFKSRDLSGIFYEISNDKNTGFLDRLLPSTYQTLRENMANTPDQETPDPFAGVVKNLYEEIRKLWDSGDNYFKSVEKFIDKEHTKRFTQKHEIKTDLVERVQVVNGLLKEFVPHTKDKDQKAALDFANKRCTEIAMGIDEIQELPNLPGKDFSHVVAWAETHFAPNKSKSYSVVNAPIFLKPILKRIVFDALKSVVLTSATMAVAGDNPFRMIESTLGMNNPMRLRLPAVFDYAKQACIIVIEDMPPQSAKDYEEALSEQVKKFVKVTNGGAFVLFTSFKTMNAVYDAISISLELMGCKLFCQGKDLNRNAMIEEFKKTNKGVLFGVSSFWTGVDIPGQALRNLIITKLPFPSPAEPLLLAQEEIYKKSGRNFFMEKLVPMTCIALKQGFGRLIRTTQDKGIAVILDSRVVTAKYGPMMLKSLPNECPIRKARRDSTIS